ncbi:DUF4003 domain-containing protein [Clostridium subterminale]|uniref:DUF4003 domain-containing protein n=1 Tax=Clostridium subterminale TaxID=1550 RepID=A0ABN1KMR1_CLOSU
MNTRIENKLDIFADYTIQLGKVLKWDYRLSHMLCSMLYTNEERILDANRIKEMRDYIKKNTSIFSSFKGTTLPIIATMLSLDESPERLFTKTQLLYDKMKQQNFRGSEYLTIAAMQVAKIKIESEHDRVINRMKEFYDKLRKVHPFLTSTDDYIYVAMVAMTDIDLDLAIRRVVTIENRLKPILGGGNDMQALALVLLITDNDDDELCSKVLELYKCLKDKKYKLHYNGTMSTLGVLAMTSSNMYLIAEELVNGAEYLKDKKGFGAFSIGKVQRAMFSANFVALQYVGDMKNNLLEGTISNNITNIIIAQQMATIAATMAATSAASSAN